MKSRLLLTLGAALLTLVVSVNVHSGWWPFSKDDEASVKGDVLEIMWDDLIPDDFVQPVDPFSTMSQEEIDKLLDGSDESNARLAKMQEEFNYAPVVPELDGKRVKLPAYITPLEFDGQTQVKEFLLVPYVGACIHTPPPPANQVVFAESDRSIQNPGMYSPIWAIGTIYAETVQSALAETGYRLEIEEVFPYSE